MPTVSLTGNSETLGLDDTEEGDDRGEGEGPEGGSHLFWIKTMTGVK